MPWVAIGPISVSGYQVLRIADTFNEEVLSLFLYAIPILGVLTVLAELSYFDINPSNRTTLARATGGLPIVGLLYLLVSLAQQFPSEGGKVVADVFQAMAIGAYVTLGAAIALVRKELSPQKLSRHSNDAAGVALTIFALWFALGAISNFAKPFSHDPNGGFVFMGVRLSGTANAIMGPLFGFLLLAYAYGIWSMRRYALPVSYIYAACSIVNTVLFAIRNSRAQPSDPVSIASIVVVTCVAPLATAIILHRQVDLI